MMRRALTTNTLRSVSLLHTSEGLSRTRLQHRPLIISCPISKLSPKGSKRQYTRVIYQNPRKGNGQHPEHINGDLPEILPQTQPVRLRSKPIRFLNPWVDLANVTDDAVLAQKVDSVTRTFGVVAGLMCSLSAAALAVIPSADEEHQHDNSKGSNNNANNMNGRAEQQNKSRTSVQRRNTRSMFSTQHVSGTSLLVGMGLSGKQLADIYAACSAGSFYASVCAMGLSAVVNAWLACTPPGGTKYFVRHNSLVICSIPGFLALSTGLAGTALFIGLDRSTGTPVSYIGLTGTALGGLLVGSATVRGMVCTYSLLTPLVRRL